MEFVLTALAPSSFMLMAVAYREGVPLVTKKFYYALFVYSAIFLTTFYIYDYITSYFPWHDLIGDACKKFVIAPSSGLLSLIGTLLIFFDPTSSYAQRRR